jgi:hypothetical protein
MTTPVRYPNGFNDHAQGNAGMGQFYPQPDPARYVRYFNDFHVFTAGDWTVTESQAGATQAIVAGHGGILALTNTGTDNDLNAIQNPQETFRFAVGRKAWIRTKFKLSEVTESDAIVGLYITDTSPLATLPSDGVFFYKADGAAALVAQVRKDGAASTISLGNMVADTYETLELYYDGKSTFTAFVDGVPTGTDITVTTNMPDDEEIAVGIAVQAGDGNADTLSIDFIEVLMERT